jgi:hypothetical protein
VRVYGAEAYSLQVVHDLSRVQSTGLGTGLGTPFTIGTHRTIREKILAGRRCMVPEWGRKDKD